MAVELLRMNRLAKSPCGLSICPLLHPTLAAEGVFFEARHLRRLAKPSVQY
jgi:hypothetical protein